MVLLWLYLLVSGLSVVHTWPVDDGMMGQMDEDRDGRLNYEELMSYVMAYDQDGSSGLSQDEYQSMTRARAPSLLGYSGLLFNLFDANRDEILDQVDMLGLFNTMDSDSDSLVNRIEMIRFASDVLRKLTSHR
ncbi:uncharacterized protein LOC131946317 [Physella acuta]|uniref:uncharacterized protein LOC131946317 n=1 Tax=Physella acuta TaxID=109671 RepID=UPI0027DE2F79|nr:uncharacterized protein LOC131946317 [Physella acuta]